MPLPYSKEPNETITGQPANVEVMLIEREKEPITASMVKHNQSFTKGEVTKLVNLMNEYRLCFAFNIFELGCTNALTMDKESCIVMGKFTGIFPTPGISREYNKFLNIDHNFQF